METMTSVRSTTVWQFDLFPSVCFVALSLYLDGSYPSYPLISPLIQQLTFSPFLPCEDTDSEATSESEDSQNDNDATLEDEKSHDEDAHEDVYRPHPKTGALHTGFVVAVTLQFDGSC